ncbi:transcription termination/antitermination NusG family protein, partial [Arthrospira platensis SPKY1]|nr:transcription termination/antitermination NusG family protein [Arthrospira platensis SPKY1]
MASKWYVVNTYSGNENKVKTNLEQRIKSMGMEGKIFRVLVPSEEVSEIRGGKKKISTKRFFPGYVLVEMEIDDEAWYVVRNTPKVTGFV